MRISGKSFVAAVLALALPLGLALADEKPVKKPDAKKPGGGGYASLAASQKLVSQAYDKLDGIGYDPGGHAAKAKALLKQANDEIKLAKDQADNDDDKSTRKEKKKDEKQ